MNDFDRINNPKDTINPKPNLVSKAYSEARDILGDTPKTSRETLLFEALQRALQDKHDKPEADEVRDLRDELQKAEDELEQSEDRAEAEENRADAALDRLDRLRKMAPDKPADLIAAKDLVRQFRRNEPQIDPKGVVSGIRRQYEHREMTVLVDDLVREIEAWRKIFEVLT